MGGSIDRPRSAEGGAIGFPKAPLEERTKPHQLPRVVLGHPRRRLTKRILVVLPTEERLVGIVSLPTECLPTQLDDRRPIVRLGPPGSKIDGRMLGDSHGHRIQERWVLTGLTPLDGRVPLRPYLDAMIMRVPLLAGQVVYAA